MLPPPPPSALQDTTWSSGVDPGVFQKVVQDKEAEEGLLCSAEGSGCNSGLMESHSLQKTLESQLLHVHYICTYV